MANTLRFKRGLVAGIPTGVAGEPLFTTDTFDLYIGNGTTNTRFQKYIASGTTLQYLRGDGSLATFPTNIVTGTGVAGQVAYWSGTNTQVGSNNLFWDATNNRLGIGTNNPLLNVVINSASGSNATLALSENNLLRWYTRHNAGTGNFEIVDVVNTLTRLIVTNTGNLGLGVTPSAWSLTGSSALQVKNTSLYAVGNDGGLVSNAYFNTGFGGWFHIATARAARYDHTSGNHQWFTSTSGTAGTAVSFTQAMTLTANGRLLLGSTSEGTQTLQVTGDTLLKGSGNTSGTTALLVDNSDGSDLLKVRNDGVLLIGNSANAAQLRPVNTSGILDLGGDALGFVAFATTNSAGVSSFNFTGTTLTSTSGFNGLISIYRQFAPTSGTAQATYLNINPTINQTGGANGITRGLYIQPTLTAAADWRSIEWSNNTGWGLYGSGTAANYLGGKLGIGSTDLSAVGLRVSRASDSSNFYTSVFVDSAIQSSVTGIYYSYYSRPNIQNTTFTLTNLQHFSAREGTTFDTSTATVTNQYGFYAYEMIKATNNYGFYGNIASGTGRWNLYMNGSAANFLAGSLLLGTTTNSLTGGGATIYHPTLSEIVLQNATTGTTAGNGFQIAMAYADVYLWNFENSAITFATNNVERVKIFGDGNFGIGTGSTNAGFKLDVNGTMKVTGASTLFTTAISSTTNVEWTNSLVVSGGANGDNSGTRAYFRPSGSFGAAIYGGRWSSTDRGARLVGLSSGSAENAYIHLNGESSEVTIATGGTIRQTIASTGAATFSSTLTTGGNILLGATASTVGALNFIKTGTSPVASRLTFGTDGTGYSFAIGKNQAGTVTDLFSILDSGAANFTTSIQAATAIAIGTTPDTNKPFKILKNINTTVGINFENTSTSSLAFSAIQMGTDVTGGTKFTNLVYGSSGITQNGVYHPDGTSLINNGGGGLNFLGTPTRFYTGGSNGIVRLYLDNNGLTQLTATTPTTSETDGYRQYSADVVAGNAAPHFRTENGAVIKLYQETTGVGNAIFSAGGGTGVLDDSTFDGYTLRQIVKALRNQGILA